MLWGEAERINLHFLEKRRDSYDMIKLRKWSKTMSRGNTDSVKRDNNDRTRNNGFKLDEIRFREVTDKKWCG